MELNKYEVFLKNLETGSFTETADKLGYTPSGVTHMMNALEDELGLTLLNRGKGGVNPTEDGKRIAEKMRAVLKAQEDLMQTAADINGLETGHINVHLVGSVARNIIPKILKQFHRDYPGIKVELNEIYSDLKTNELVRDPSFTFMIEALFGEEKYKDGLTVTPFFEDEIVLIVSEIHPLAGMESISLEELRGEAFIVLGKDVWPTGYEEILKANGLLENVSFVSRDEPVVVELVRENMGIAILPYLHVWDVGSRLKIVRLRPRIYRELCFAQKSGLKLTKAEEKFKEYVLSMRGVDNISDYML